MTALIMLLRRYWPISCRAAAGVSTRSCWGQGAGYGFRDRFFHQGSLGYAIAAFPRSRCTITQKTSEAFWARQKRAGYPPTWSGSQTAQGGETEFEKNSVAGLAMSVPALAVEGGIRPRMT